MKSFAFGLAIFATVQAADCGKHQQWKGSSCVCKKGYIKHNGVCARCPYDSKFNCDTYQCDCNDKLFYDEYANSCNLCPRNAHFEPKYNRCECNYAFKMWEGKCVPDCGQYERFTPGGGCDCIQGYTKYDGKKCQKCPVNGHWQVAYNACQCNYGFKMWDGKCVPDCKEHQVFTAGGGCTCEKNYNKYDGKVCTRCPPRSWYDSYNDKCVCEWGFSLKDGYCVKY